MLFDVLEVGDPSLTDVSSAVHSAGGIVGPRIDMSSSRYLSLQSMRVIEWLIWLIRGGRVLTLVLVADEEPAGWQHRCGRPRGALRSGGAPSGPEGGDLPRDFNPRLSRNRVLLFLASLLLTDAEEPLS